jgi:hypothetical protein
MSHECLNFLFSNEVYIHLGFHRLNSFASSDSFAFYDTLIGISCRLTLFYSALSYFSSHEDDPQFSSSESSTSELCGYHWKNVFVTDILAYVISAVVVVTNIVLKVCFLAWQWFPKTLINRNCQLRRLTFRWDTTIQFPMCFSSTFFLSFFAYACSFPFKISQYIDIAQGSFVAEFQRIIALSCFCLNFNIENSMRNWGTQNKTR